MAIERKKNNTGNAAAEKKRIRKALLAAALIVLCIVLAVLGLYFSGKMLFSGNSRFALREVKVSGAGFWQKHEKLLANAIGLRMGQNLFALDYSELRKKVQSIPSVDNASVIRVLPDTIVIKITERIPRAVLNNPGSAWVVDNSATLMPRSQVMKTGNTLPVIAGVKLKNVRQGERVPEITSAMELIMMAVENFQDINIFYISVQNPEKLDIYLKYRSFASCRVIMPTRNRGWSFMLHTLQSAIVQAKLKGENRTTFDLSYDGRVVIR